MSDTQTSEWIEHDGKGMPVDGDALVQTRFNDGYATSDAFPARWWAAMVDDIDHWVRSDKPSDITAYRVVKP